MSYGPRSYDQGRRRERGKYENSGPSHSRQRNYGFTPRRSNYESLNYPPRGPRSRPTFSGWADRSRRDSYEGRDRRPPYRSMKNDHERRDLGDMRRGNILNVYRPPPSMTSGRDGAARPCRVLGVFGLSSKTIERDLYSIFSEFGRVEDIQMVYDSLTGHSRGFAFVYFDTIEDARNAKVSCDCGLEIHDRMVRVDYSVTQRPHAPTPGIYMGKFNRRPDVDSRRMQDSRHRSGGRYRSPSPRGDTRRGRSPSSVPRSRKLPHSNGSSVRRIRTLSSSRSRSPPPIFSPKRRCDEEDGIFNEDLHSRSGNSQNHQSSAQDVLHVPAGHGWARASATPI